MLSDPHGSLRRRALSLVADAEGNRRGDIGKLFRSYLAEFALKTPHRQRFHLKRIDGGLFGQPVRGSWLESDHPKVTHKCRLPSSKWRDDLQCHPTGILHIHDDGRSRFSYLIALTRIK